jgi:serine/threonine protein kinase
MQNDQACAFHRNIEYPGTHVEGDALHLKFTGREPLSEDQVVTWLKQLASGVAFLHARGRSHSNLKPETVKIDREGVLVISGFETVTCESNRSPGGASLYASYEKARGLAYDGRDDMWAVGCILLELLLNRR